MKAIFLAAILTISTLLTAQTYYVQDPAYNDNASDMNLGTDINRPWATWQRAFETAEAGDTVYFRDGIWYPESQVFGWAVTTLDPANGYGNSGTYDKPICFFNYPGEKPVLDCQRVNSSNHGNIGININETTYVEFKGLTICNVRMMDDEKNSSGIEATKNGVISFENITAHHIGGAGMWISKYDTLYLKNCDVYNVCDSLDRQEPGGDGDGYNITSGGTDADTFKIAYISGCRSWNTSDDGYDISTTKQFQIRDCWSWNNGHLSGDGTGFKFAYSHLFTTSKRRVINCITVYNESSDGEHGSGFVELNLKSEIGPFCEYLNNTSFKDHNGFGQTIGNFDCVTDPVSMIYRNNLVYEPSGGYQAGFKSCNYGYPTYVIQDHNTWVQANEYWQTEPNPAYNVNDGDFESSDLSIIFSALKAERDMHGNLPPSPIRLTPGSDLIDAGIDVGLPFFGPAPDIGAFEYGSLSVEIFAPIAGKKYSYGNDILIKARVEDTNDEIEEVKFYSEGKERLLGKGEKTKPSVWEFTWENEAVGYQGIRAVAINSKGDSATSSLVHILINPDREPGNDSLCRIIPNLCRIIPNPNNGVFLLELSEPLERNSNIRIFSMQGQLIAVDHMKQNEIIKEFNLSNIASGTYGLVYENDEDYQPCQGIKIIKQ